MPFSLSMDLQQKPSQSVKQLQKLIMTRQMQQAIHLLQMPSIELANVIDIELQQNPILEKVEEGEDTDLETQQLQEEIEEEAPPPDQSAEQLLKFDDRDLEVLRRLDEEVYASLEDEHPVKRSPEDEKLHSFLENSIPAKPSLFEHLMIQSEEVFNTNELRLAEAIIGNLDTSGFLETPLSEIALLQGSTVEEIEKVLAVIKTFHPCGVGASSLQEALMLQLEAQNKQDSLAYKIVKEHFDDLLHNKILKIKKGLHCKKEEIEEALYNHIAKLDLHPATQLSKDSVPYIVPDITLKEEDQKLVVSVNDEYIPRLRLSHRYLKMLEDPNLSLETKEFIKKKIMSAKWLMRNILQRNSTLERIVESLAKRHRDFFLNPEGKLVPLTMKVVSEELELHESTIARAVANKYMETPRGLFPIRFFFTNALSNHKGDSISSNTVKELLLKIIEKEDKRNPLSDETISAMIKEQGIKCARRTIAKYRNLLKIGNTQQRRKF